MKRVLKFPIQVVDRQEIFVPKDSYIMTAKFQRQQLCLWALCEETQTTQDRIEVVVLPTGQTSPSLQPHHRFIGTVFEHNGALDWHVFAGKV